MKRIFSILLLTVLVLSLCACKKTPGQTINEDDIRAVCELATLKCYYNNVARIEKKADTIFQKDRKMWIEYEGEVVIGVDMSKVVINVNGDVVSITLPAAEVQSIQPITKTLTEDSYISSADGFLFKNKITTEDQQAAIEAGQEEMKQAVLSNSGLFSRAEARAKELIEEYIVNLGRATGKEYTIQWVSE